MTFNYNYKSVEYSTLFFVFVIGLIKLKEKFADKRIKYRTIVIFHIVNSGDDENENENEKRIESVGSF